MDNFRHISRRRLLRISGFALFVLLVGMMATPARASQDVVQFGNTIEVAKDAKQGQIGLSSGLVEPLNAMGPGSVVDDIRKVGMEREGEKADWLGSEGCRC